MLLSSAKILQAFKALQNQRKRKKSASLKTSLSVCLRGLVLFWRGRHKGSSPHPTSRLILHPPEGLHIAAVNTTVIPKAQSAAWASQMWLAVEKAPINSRGTGCESSALFWKSCYQRAAWEHGAQQWEPDQCTESLSPLRGQRTGKRPLAEWETKVSRRLKMLALVCSTILH